MIDTNNTPDVLVFDQQDEPYLAWVAAHPGAFVLTTPRNPKGYTMLHSADCRLITKYMKNYVQGAFTEHKYIKVSAMSTSSLIKWASTNRPFTMPPRICTLCDRRRGLKELASGYFTDVATVATPEVQQQELEEDIDELLKRPDLNSKPSTRTALIEARRGQGTYRRKVLSLWDNRCAISGLAVEAALVASHAVSWRESSDDERLDPHNGLPLAATLDKLFDRHLVAFDPGTGEMQVSKSIPLGDQKLLGLPLPLVAQLSDKQTGYLARHLKEFLRVESNRPNAV